MPGCARCALWSTCCVRLPPTLCAALYVMVEGGDEGDDVSELAQKLDAQVKALEDESGGKAKQQQVC